MKSILLSIMVLVFSLFSWNGLAAKGSKIPLFELVSLDGEVLTQEDLEGKVTLFVFWASWCGVCRNELPKINQLNEKMAGKAFQIVAVGFRDSEENISRYVKMHPKHFSYPVYYDKEDQVSSQFGAMATPTLFLFDKKGELVIPYRGGGLLEHPEFQKILKELV